MKGRPMLAAVLGSSLILSVIAATAPRTRILEPELQHTTPAGFADSAVPPRTVEVQLTASAARLSLLPGTETEVLAYNGAVPGPTLELHEGDSVIVHFRNDLTEPTTIHWHGLHIPFTSDGSPFHPVAPGGRHDYVFRLHPGTAGTYWYHPHPNHQTGHQIGRGLYGAIIVRAPNDPLPATLREQLLILADNRFRPDRSIDFAEPGSVQAIVDQENGREGDVLFVNGKVMPSLAIRSGEVQRWRVVNASASRVYRLTLPGHKLLHIGSDGGLFERPVEADEVLVANGERVELLVRGSGAPGESVMLQTLPYDRYIPQTRPQDWNRARDLVTLTYTKEPAGSSIEIPAVLRAVPPLDTARATATRVITLSQGLINGKTMDMERIDVTTSLGATEIWQIENIVGMDHPFHLHGFQFQVLDRNGVPEPFRSWKDTINVPKHETVRVIVRFADYAGKWMFHCHILDHEDNGMMAILEVR